MFKHFLLKKSLYVILIFLRNTVQHRRSHTRAHTHPYERTHARTPYPYEHLRNTESAGRVLRLTKSPRAPRCRRERRLPLKEYSAFYATHSVKPGV